MIALWMALTFGVLAMLGMTRLHVSIRSSDSNAAKRTEPTLEKPAVAGTITTGLLFRLASPYAGNGAPRCGFAAHDLHTDAGAHS